MTRDMCLGQVVSFCENCWGNGVFARIAGGNGVFARIGGNGVFARIAGGNGVFVTGYVFEGTSMKVFLPIVLLCFKEPFCF